MRGLQTRPILPPGGLDAVAPMRPAMNQRRFLDRALTLMAVSLAVNSQILLRYTTPSLRKGRLCPLPNLTKCHCQGILDKVAKFSHIQALTQNNYVLTEKPTPKHDLVEVQTEPQADAAGNTRFARYSMSRLIRSRPLPTSIAGLLFLAGILFVLRGLLGFLLLILKELFVFIGRVCKHVLWIIALPSAIWISYTLLYLGVAIHAQRFVEVLQSPVAHMCNAPVVSSYWHWWPCTSRSTSLHPVLPDFLGLGGAEESLQTIVDESIDITASGWKLWKSDMAVQDLVAYVSSSDLECKDVLVPLLNKLVVDINTTAEALRVLSSVIKRSANR